MGDSCIKLAFREGFHYINVRKTAGTIKKKQSIDTGNIGHKTQNYFKQSKTKYNTIQAKQNDKNPQK